MRIAIACPYLWDVPGGVQYHIRDLAGELISRGHEVSVITPCEDESLLPDFAVSAGSAVAIPYNGSVARLAFGPRVSWRVRNWIQTHDFDVLHVHEPFIPSVSMMALMAASCPVVATFHAATDRSRALEIAAPMLRPLLEKITSRIAVSAEARRTAVSHLGSDAYVIPNGVFVSALQGEKRPQWHGSYPTSPVVAFLGRLDEPRKGLPVLAHAWPDFVRAYPHARLLIAGRGNQEAARAMFSPYDQGVEFLGEISDTEKADLLSSADMYIAPNTGGESFGIILIEAMSAGCPVIASSIPAFRAVLQEGDFGFIFEQSNPHSLARVMVEAYEDVQKREKISQKAQLEAWRYDWQTVATQVSAVYENAISIYSQSHGQSASHRFFASMGLNHMRENEREDIDKQKEQEGKEK